MIEPASVLIALIHALFGTDLITTDSPL